MSIASPAPSSQLPAVRLDAHGVRHVDRRAVLALALPLFINASLQAVLNLTDTWFLGRVSADAVAAIGAVYWLILAAMLLLGGIGIAVQTLVAQAFGSGRRRRASAAMWMGVWGGLATTPLFLMFGFLGEPILRVFELSPTIQRLAIEYWWPRLAGGGIAVALWSMLSFFNGLGRPRVPIVVNLFVAIANAALNELLIFDVGMGVAGAAWASTIATALGALIALGCVVSAAYRVDFATARTWRPRARVVKSLFALGLPTGLFIAFDVGAMAVFQLFQVRLGPVDGAATQIVMMITSVAFMPAVGIGMAGTTLVGQSIGAGDRAWAYRVGNATIVMAVVYMTLCGLVLALSGPVLLPLFVVASDPRAVEVAQLGVTLLWIAAAYQFFDGLNLGCGFCLRGAGDARVPALALAILGWGVFIPLTHMLAFAPGEGMVAGLPQVGWGAAGGWVAAVAYVSLLGTMLALRWRSRAWERMRVL